MSANKTDVAAFLREFKRVALSESNFYLVGRVENNRDIVRLGLTKGNVVHEIASLSVADYCAGPEADRDRAGEVWKFGKCINGHDVYIKLKIASTGRFKIAKCISFHIAQYPLHYPLR